MSEHAKPPTLPDDFIVGDWRVLRTQNRLGHLRETGTIEQLEPKAMDVLCVLAGRGQQTVTREELLESVWPGRMVVEGALTRVIRDLRAALRDDAKAPVYIETVTKRGYRLLIAPEFAGSTSLGSHSPVPESAAALRSDPPPAAPVKAPRRSPWVFAAGAVAVVVAWWVISPLRTSSTARTVERPVRILWVDDRHDGNSREIARLQQMGYIVDTATSNAQAALQLQGREYDLVLSDIYREGGGSGYEGLQLPRALIADRNRLPPVIYYVGKVKGAKTEDGYPVTDDPDELMRLVSDVLVQHPPRAR
jgi:DNA-binding winged helix-turn-helix (wHTH) protein/CheY-like chemotaxis protein